MPQACSTQAAGRASFARSAHHRPRAQRPHIARIVTCSAIVGIDLGTSNSAVAAIVDGEARVLRGAHGSASVPSVVSFVQDTGEMLVGQAAVDVEGVRPADRIHSFKRLMGRKLQDVEEAAARLGYSVGEGDRGEAVAYSPAADSLLSPEELSSWVLQHLKARAEEQLQDPVTGAVVTVPAHFKQAQQCATHTAAQQAGIAQVQLLQEPVAAALAYGINGGTDGDTVLVFDVGGGTFDISVLQAFEGIMEVLGTAGDAALGGNDFDARLAGWVEVRCAAAGLPLPAGTPLAAAEAAKIALSAGDRAEVALAGGASLALTRQQFEEATAPLFQLMANVLEALGDALFIQWAVRPSDAVPGRAPSQQPQPQQEQQDPGSSGDRWAPPPRRITQVALVGQLTRLPSVQQFVATITGVQPRMTVDPAEAVALGAAIHAGVLLGQVSGVELMDGSYSQDLHDRATGFTGWQP